ncbi:MAG TPA: hypothetical protein VMY76_01985 [Gemmatimonadales bacterium]|nr:hypothetical protein [Gemmatimonadales bacterium]
MSGGRTSRGRRPRALALVATLLATACSGSLPPLRGQMEVGRDAYAVFVGGGGAAGGDLYAVRTEGGVVVPITFTGVGEMRPALSPDGSMAAFLRGTSLRDSVPGSVWVMNLLSGAEREIDLPPGAGPPRRVAWMHDGRGVFVESASGIYRTSVPPDAGATLVSQSERAPAESALAVLLGRPAFARVIPCAEEGALCTAGDTGTPGFLARGARDAFRWGDDSVAFFVGNAVEIRPLGAGRARRLGWRSPPSHPRQMTVFLGSARPSS